MSILSPERVGRITGSRIAAILGESPYNDRDGVLREMVRERLGAPTEFVGNIATEWGQNHEEEATTEYERYRSVMVHSAQTFYVHPTIDYMGCTPDGFVGEVGMVEIKCPYKATYSAIEDRPDYAHQIQLQLEVTDREWTDFVVWRPTGLAVSRVGRDPGWMFRVGETLDKFIAEYEDIIHDPELHRPYLDEPEPIPVRDDFEWQLAALEFLEARAAAERAEAARDAARKALIALAAGEPTKGAGVAVSVAERRGGVAYADAVKKLLPGVDLEEFRKPSTTVTTVRVAA